jgi:hypothetical protein
LIMGTKVASPTVPVGWSGPGDVRLAGNWLAAVVLVAVEVDELLLTQPASASGARRNETMSERGTAEAAGFIENS